MYYNKVIGAEIRSNIAGMKIYVKVFNFPIKRGDSHIEKKYIWLYVVYNRQNYHIIFKKNRNINIRESKN